VALDINQLDLVTHFNEMSDEELIIRCSSCSLTEIAQQIANTELEERGLVLPKTTTLNGSEISQNVDFTTVAQSFSPTDAYLIAGFLEAEGIPTIVADANFVQANSLLSIAVGGVRIQVPINFVTEAQKVIEAWERGDFALKDDDESYLE
jgi:hypothetical protein